MHANNRCACVTTILIIVRSGLARLHKIDKVPGDVINLRNFVQVNTSITFACMFYVKCVKNGDKDYRYLTGFNLELCEKARAAIVIKSTNV